MPKRVDHEQRRRQVADAVLRVAAARGLHATGMREVAAEAGVSVRLVQYYFGTKEELLLYTIQYLALRFSERAMARIRAAGGVPGNPDPRNVISSILTTALPDDEESRLLHVVYTAYLALALTDPALAIAPLVRNSSAVIDVVAAQLSAAQSGGRMPAGLDARVEAISLIALSSGLGSSVLGGQTTSEDAKAIIDYHLDRLLPVPGGEPGLARRDPTAGSLPTTPGGPSCGRRPGPGR
jgi:AcrR family transcriptional regulator